MLLYLRVLVPGLILIAGFYPIYYKEQIFISEVDFNYVILFAVLLGSVYFQSPFQFMMIKGAVNEIDTNIFKRFVDIYNSKNPQRPADAGQQEAWLKNKKYLHVFYHVVDSDESLKAKASIAYFHSIFWSSTADSILINSLFSIVYCIMTIWNGSTYKPFIFVFALVTLLSFLLHRLSVDKHIRNSSQQLDYMELYHADDVSKGLAAISS